MTRDPLDRVAAFAPAPDRPTDPDGLADARARFEAGRRADDARRAPASRRTSGGSTFPWSRLALTAGLATATAVAVLAVTAAMGPGGEPGQQPSQARLLGLVPAAAAANPACGAASVDQDLSTPMDRSTWSSSPVADVAAVVGQRRPDRVTVYEEIRHCPAAVASAVIYDPDELKGINVYRDVAAGHLTEIETLAAADTVSLRGVDGWVLAWTNEPGVPRQRLTWIDQDGVRWYAVAEGMLEGDTLAVLDALEFDAEGDLEPSSVPDGLEHAPVLDPEVGERSTYTWAAEYGVEGGTVVEQDGGSFDQPGPTYLYLEVTTPATAPVEAEVAEFRNEIVDLDGKRAAWTPHGQGGAELRWVQDGVRYRLVAQVDGLEAMRELARTVEPVDLDDPRLG